jgi:hypothetical protein
LRLKRKDDGEKPLQKLWLEKAISIIQEYIFVQPIRSMWEAASLVSGHPYF